MENQAMDPWSNLDKIEILENEVADFERKLVVAKEFDSIWNNKNFQSSVMDTMLGSEAKDLAASLLDVGMTDDKAQTVLFELKSLRCIKRLFERKANDLEKVEASLKAANKLLLDEMSSNKD